MDGQCPRRSQRRSRHRRTVVEHHKASGSDPTFEPAMRTHGRRTVGASAQRLLF